MSKWDEAAGQLADAIITILKENNVPPDPENIPRIQIGSQQFIQTIRAAVIEEFGN